MTPEGKLKSAEARRGFERLAALPDASIDLAHAALLVAAEEVPDVDVEHYRARLFELGLAARAYVAARSWEPVEALSEFVFRELGFVGNQSNYYDPRNSLLPYVIEERRGIPITLSIVYMELGRRAGLDVEGVGLPGHFVVRVRADTARGAETRLVDPFNRRAISEEDCQELLDSLYGGQVALAEEHLRAATNREILARVLRNLKAVHAQSRRYRRALAAVERIRLLDPEAHDERRDRGVLLAQLGRYTEAVAELQAYLSRTVPDEEQVREQLKKVWVQLAMLN
ncbi:MAG: tetratricopeptide repeat protein [Acidobacteriota bacterium]|nr:tetratricopeptide repeat protein [Acidobacteriota bacterium]